MTQGERIRFLRKELGLTLEKFGERLNISLSGVSKIEKGERSLTDRMVKDICREYKVNYDWLVYGDGEIFADLPSTILDELCLQYKLDDLDKTLIELYITLDEQTRTTLKEHISKKLLKE